MISAVITIIVNAVSLYAISKLLPDFRVKDESTALQISVGYSVLAYLGTFFIVPLTAIVGIGLAIIAFIPFIGPLLAGAAGLVTAFLVIFCTSAILLIILDKFMDDFEMKSMVTPFVAALLLSVLNVLIRFVVPGI